FLETLLETADSRSSDLSGRRRLLGIANFHFVSIYDRDFIITVLIFAIPEGAFLFSGLFEQHRCGALRTGFGYRLVPINLVALRVIGAPVKNFSSPRLLNHDITAILRTRHAQSFAFNVIALRIIRTRNEFTKSALAFYQMHAVFRT